MAKKGPTPTDPKAVAAAMKRVMPLVKALPKEERLKESQILASALRGAALLFSHVSDEVGRELLEQGRVALVVDLRPAIEHPQHVVLEPRLLRSSSPRASPRACACGPCRSFRSWRPG